MLNTPFYEIRFPYSNSLSDPTLNTHARISDSDARLLHTRESSIVNKEEVASGIGAQGITVENQDIRISFFVATNSEI